MVALKTKARRTPFQYQRTPSGGVRIHFGNNRQATMSAEDLRALLDAFRGRTVKLGTSRDNPPPCSVDEWLQANVTPVAIASYVGPRRAPASPLRTASPASRASRCDA